jgi:hypothetical protein
MFWRLGFTNAWRNLERSFLAILSIAMASGFMTYATSYSRGYAAGLHAHFRALNGGEISVYSINLNLTAADSEAIWQYNELHGLYTSDLQVMMPELFREGYIANQREIVGFSYANMAKISQDPAVRYVYPRYQMPAVSFSRYGSWQTPLRGRDLLLDSLQHSPLSDFVTQGRWFEASDEGRFVAVVAAKQDRPFGHPAPGPGDTLQIMVPRILITETGMNLDYGNPISVELRVIGVVDAITRVFRLGDSFWNPIQMLNNEIHLPLTSWQTIWTEASGGATFSPTQIALLIDDFTYVEDTVMSLRHNHPELSIYSMPSLIHRVDRLFTMENPERVLVDPNLSNMLQRSSTPPQAVLVQDLRLPLITLILFNAALVVASNLLIMATERAREIGILKAIGATRFQIAQLILSEALLISLVGGIVGFAFFRFPAALNQFTNRVALATVASMVLVDFILVVGASCIAVLLFALMPAIRMTRFSVREILQGESV